MIPRELIAKVRRIEIRTNRLVNEMLAGQYQSVFKGRGMAFDEVRQYMPGDDIRLIDWKVSARMNDVYIKLFVEEREMTVMLLVDMSGSGDFGTAEQSKREVAAEMAALLAFSAIKNNDRVGLIIFTDRVEKFVPPKKGSKHVLRVITEILSFEPEGRGTDLRSALEYLGHVSRHKSVAFLFSDFQDSDYEQSLKIAHRRHDLIPVVIADPMEERLPSLGVLMMQDLETGRVVAFDTSPSQRAMYHRRVAQIRQWREAMFRRYKIDFINVQTDEPYVQPLVQFFKARERRLRR